MVSYAAPTDDIEFLLYDVFDAEHEWQDDHLAPPKDVVLAILEQCSTIARDVMAPLSQSADAEGAHWHDGEVTTPKGFQRAFRELTEGGWLSVSGNPKYGAQGLPKLLTAALEEMFWGANTNLWLYAALTTGAAYCIDAHASDSLKQQFLPRLYEGSSTGAMALTESHAGSDLGLLRTRAKPQSDGTYRITGTKIFITSGEHDLAENIIHLVLARLPDAPPGSRGISLFLVPKYLVDATGAPTTRNAFASGSIEHKMGIRGSATSVMNYDGSEGYLIGEPNAGLRCMFTMMNYARLSTGIQGLALAERAYQFASTYARERLQGRSPTGPKQEYAPADAIIEHPDVRRMLLMQRSYVEGGRAFSMLVSMYLDRAHRASYGRGDVQSTRLVELLTPIAKAFLSDRGLEVALSAQQVFGGHGYIQETGIEQIVRDVRIAQIYEGTNGIQAHDLINRKVLMDGGETVRLFVNELRQTPVDTAYVPELTRVLDLWLDTTDWICGEAKSDVSLASAVAVDYLDLSGHAIYAWLWARMSHCETTAIGKNQLAVFYFDKLLPKVDFLARTIRKGSGSVMAPGTAWF